MRLERAELLGPERLDLVQPGLQSNERLGPQAIHPQSRVVVDELGFDEAALAQDPQMAAHRRTAHADGGGELAGALGTTAEEVDDRAPRGVGERGKGDIDLREVISHHLNR
jgi:hypothetical protein